MSGMPSPFLILLLVSSSNLEIYMSMKSSDFFLRNNMKYMPYTDTGNINLLLQKYTGSSKFHIKTISCLTVSSLSNCLC